MDRERAIGEIQTVTDVFGVFADNNVNGPTTKPNRANKQTSLRNSTNSHRRTIEIRANNQFDI